ncbi:MAG: ABC transporter ATP-binding protein [Gemmatimonadetes bacterium]|nr:ABC transporter ATP-binding protein [Gemmatimonadota bacterium]
MLELRDLSKNFGGVRAVDKLTVTIEKGEIFGLIGPNGSGKSTIVNLICGVFSASEGAILLNGKDLGTMPPHRRLRAGIARTFQNIRLFGELTVWQNLSVARNSIEDVAGQGFLSRWFGSTNRVREEIDEMLEFAGLADKVDELAANLAFGEQRRLELARALATKPKMLLLDEPAAGMNLEEVKDLDGRIRKLRDSGITVLLVEHVMELVMGVADRITVLNFGQKIAEGSPIAIQNDSTVQEVYLGKS